MPRRPTRSRLLATAARWPVGVGLTSWRYLWRTTPLHRAERPGSMAEDAAPAVPDGVTLDELQDIGAGVGPVFHRTYSVRVRDAQLGAEELMARLQADPDRVSPSEFASFVKVHGTPGHMAVGDEYVVRMAGPWDGPVRVIDVGPRSFRLATLAGHLEAGQIEFSAAEDDGGMLTVRIESWARSGDRFSDLLYSHVRMAKEIQLHMWTSFLERTAKLTRGRVTRGITIETRRVDEPAHAG